MGLKAVGRSRSGLTKWLKLPPMKDCYRLIDRQDVCMKIWGPYTTVMSLIDESHPLS